MINSCLCFGPPNFLKIISEYLGISELVMFVSALTIGLFLLLLAFYLEKREVSIGSEKQQKPVLKKMLLMQTFPSWDASFGGIEDILNFLLVTLPGLFFNVATGGGGLLIALLTVLARAEFIQVLFIIILMGSFFIWFKPGGPISRKFGRG